MKNSMLGRGAGLAALVIAVGLCQPAAAGEEATIKAFAQWQGQGHTFQTGGHEAMFVGALVGRMYVETENGPLQSGLMSCPVTVEIGLEDGKQHGEGRCSIAGKDGAQVYAKIACTGVYLVGCNGDLTLTGGTGRFAGITGGGKVLIRSDARQISAVSDSMTKDEGTGILYLSELHYTLP